MKIIFFLLLLLFFSYFSSPVNAQSSTCDNRFATLINPVRGRDLWFDKALDHIKNQYNLVIKHNFSATWLLQYDVLKDQELLAEIKKFNAQQEPGVFLEVSEQFARHSRIIYPHNTPWFNPRAVFLSGYSQSDRRKLIDKLMTEFRQEFGIYPKSVGAWWIDSYSLNYLREKYGINVALIVADQKTTDNYGVWGQWWGVPYYPSKANILTPANSLNNKEDVVIMQWAQRDPALAYGEGPNFSNYSLQANDYIRQGKDTGYFRDLTSLYLDCRNPIGQITVGLETGVEGAGYIEEYENQLKLVSEMPELKMVTMSEFAREYSRIFPDFPTNFQVSKEESTWILNTDSRSNPRLGDSIIYQQDISFSDYFVTDHRDFLDRNLVNLKRNQQDYFPLFLIISFITGIISLRKKIFQIWLIGILFALCGFGLILRSNYQMGWEVFYGPKVPLLIFTQTFLILISLTFIWLLSRIKTIKKNNLFLYLFPLSFGIDFIIRGARFSYLEGKYYIGFAADSLRFIGIAFSRRFNFEIVNQDFPSVLANALLKFDFDKIWNNLYLAILVYPLVHIIAALVLLYLIVRLSQKKIKFIIGVLIILTAAYLLNIFQADPRLVQ